VCGLHDTTGLSRIFSRGISLNATGRNKAAGIVLSAFLIYSIYTAVPASAEPDTTPPDIDSDIAVSNTSLTDPHEIFALAVTFNEPMDVSITPTIKFLPDLSGVLDSAGGEWSGDELTWTESYLIASEIHYTSVSIQVSGAVDKAGNQQADPGPIFADVFSIGIQQYGNTDDSYDDTTYYEEPYEESYDEYTESYDESYEVEDETVEEQETDLEETEQTETADAIPVNATIIEEPEPISLLPTPRGNLTRPPVYFMESTYADPNSLVEKFKVSSMNSGKEITSYPDQILIRNTGSIPIFSMRIMLSPEIAKSFRLNETAIKVLEPRANVTVSFDLAGNRDKDVDGNLLGYNGHVIVMTEHHKPALLPVNIGAQKSNHLEEFFSQVASIADMRYNKISLLNKLVTTHAENKDFVLSSSSGTEIASASDKLVIENTSGKEIKNLRIIVSKATSAFLLNEYNIKSLSPNESFTIELLPRIDSTKYSPKDFMGEIIVVADNGLPEVIPVNIAGEEWKDSLDEYEVSSTYYSDREGMIKTAADRITIRNIGVRAMDSVRLMLDNSLQKVFTLSEEAFQHIEPNSTVTVDLKFTSGNIKTFMRNYTGALHILSEHHNTRSIPVNMEWVQISGEHFTIYARNGDEYTAAQVRDSLENIYLNATARFGQVNANTVIHMASTADEMEWNNPYGHPYYSYEDDVIVICSCNEPVLNAAKAFVYRLIINNYSHYSSTQKFFFDRENWLVDGVSGYVAANLTDKTILKQYMHLYNNTTELDWYRYGSDGQYGTTYTFFKFLNSTYGEGITDKIVYYLGSGMISNHRCDTLEECTVLRAVYDMNGTRLGDKEYRLDFDDIMQQWRKYMEENDDSEVPPV
jgi:hypothetical protein